MARQFANQTGTPNQPSTVTSRGSFIATTEVYRQKNLVNWPVVLVGVPPLPAGSYVYALSSGVTDTLVAQGQFFIADGAAVSRTTYPTLFALCSTTYGDGNGSSTFNIPNVNTQYNYLKTTTASGSSLSTLSGVGRLPSHTHTGYGVASTTSFPTNNNGNPRTLRNAGNSFTASVGFNGDPGTNQARRREQPILIANTDISQAPQGVVFPVSLPLNTNQFEAVLPSTVYVASGQAVSRSLNPILFSLINTLYGSGNGTTTFNLPDFRGLFLRGNPFGVTNISGTLASGYLLDSVARHDHNMTGRYESSREAQGFGSQPVGQGFNAPATSASNIGGTEARPANFSVVWCLAQG